MPARAVQAGRAMPQPGTYSNYYAQAEAAFRAGDVNGDGVLDAQELYMVLVRLGFFNGVPPQNVQAMMEEQMARADSSVRDRKVTFDEFVPYFEYLMHQLAQRGIVREQGIEQSAAAVAGAGVHDQTRWLVEHQQVGILVDDLERARLRFVVQTRLGGRQPGLDLFAAE